MSGFKPFDDDWPRVGRITQLTDKPPPDWAERMAHDLVNLMEKDWPKKMEAARPAAQWIPTGGEDLSQQIECKWVWAHYGNHLKWKHEPILIRAAWCESWDQITHYMPTDIRTPEPPA